MLSDHGQVVRIALSLGTTPAALFEEPDAQ